ncbi:hypothetical protein lerEdw1_020832 [Lerista edwardsae]|nr:hypothetical protein lerEdw1_020832 [Lerista edwardsae]
MAIWWKLAFVIIPILCLILHYLKQLWVSRRFPPGPLRLPFIGAVWWFAVKLSTDMFIKPNVWVTTDKLGERPLKDNVRKEIEDVFGSVQIIHYRDRKKLPYTNAVIHEIMRSKYVLLFGVPRQTAQDVNMHGFFIPKVQETDEASLLYPFSNGQVLTLVMPLGLFTLLTDSLLASLSDSLDALSALLAVLMLTSSVVLVLTMPLVLLAPLTIFTLASSAASSGIWAGLSVLLTTLVLTITQLQHIWFHP